MKVEFDCGMAGEGHNGVNPMWLGRCWGYWLPRWQWNEEWLRGLEAYVRSIVRDELSRPNDGLQRPKTR